MPDDFCQYTVLHCTLHNASAPFQHLVNTVLRGVPNCEAYLDDVVIFSSEWPQHISELKEVCDRLATAILTLDHAKCEFRQATETYLSKVVGCGKVCPISVKVDAILSFDVPGSQRELKRFLGMATYYQSFCKNFATVAATLAAMWTDICQTEFGNLKALLVTAPVLAA